MELVGSIGKFALIGGATQMFEMNLEAATAFYQEVALKKTALTMNDLGVYSFIPVGRFGKARMNSLSVPKHLLQARTGCLTWNPKGRSYLQADEIDTVPVEYDGEQCPDGLIGECLERVLGTGNQVTDIFATPEGTAFFQQAIENIFLGIGNSIYDLVSFGQDSLITSSDTGGWWNTAGVTTEEWADFKDQQLNIALKGHIPLIEEAKTAGLSNFTVDVPSGDVSGATYTGSDVTSLFDSVIDAAPAKFRTMLKRRGEWGAVMLVSKGIFDAYKDYIIANFNQIPDAYMLLIEGETVRGALMYDGIPVVCADEWTEHDEMLGVNTHRIVLTAPGNMVVASDLPGLDGQFSGMGLRIEQSTLLREKGRTYMHTTFRLGAGIADTDFMVNASRILTP
ncbi:MAG: hypothetical protein KDD10_19065 [Phaeodactylibacter sp.]|nr:hypothetical protein [Phaeodactylibacter sp.]